MPITLLEGVKAAVSRCMENWRRVYFDVPNDELVAEDDKGHVLPSRLLSDGQRTMLAMAMDIAYRAAAMNPHFGTEAPAKTPLILRGAIARVSGCRALPSKADGDSLIVYVADIDPDGAADLVSAETARANKQWMIGRAAYTKMMRFMLMDPKSRLFAVERWCFWGSIDAWHPLSGEKPLAKLLKEYVPHLGQESFFELM